MATKVAMQQVEKVNVSMSQKINMGNYETRDFFVAIEITKTPEQTIEEVVQQGKEWCAKEVGDYYREIKTWLNKPEEAEDIPELKSDVMKHVYKQVCDAENEEQLRSLESTIKKLAETKGKDIISKTYNRRIIELSE